MKEASHDAPQSRALPLTGLKVLDLSRALAGPFCSMILADLGADVIKIEPLGGEMVRTWGPFQEGISVYYLSIHRNKRSVALDFRHSQGLELLREMAAGVDIVVENFKPGVMDAMGMSYESLRERNPRLVFASITGFGRGGPYSDWPGMDQIAQGMSGLMSLTGQAATGPTRVGIPIGDVVGGMWATMGIQAAIIERQRTGHGQRIDVSLLGGLVGLLTVQGQRHLSLGETPSLAGNDHPVICPYGTFHAADGPFNMAGATDEMWAHICRLVGLQELISHPDFDSNAKRAARVEEVKRLLNERFATRSKMEWTQALVRIGVPAGPILDLQQVFSDPHVRQTGMIESIEHPTLGRLELLANPIRMESLSGRSVRRPPPLLGEDTQAVLEDLGIADDRIQALFDAGVVCAVNQREL